MSITSKLKTTTRGAAFTEYAILLGLVGVVTISAVVQFSGEAEQTFNGADAILVAQGLTGETAEMEGPPAPTAAPFTGTAVCGQATPWTYNTEYVGNSIPGQPVFAFWFGPNAPTLPATTTGGVPVIFTLPDTDGDGLIDEAEADTLTGYKWYVDTTTSEMAYHQGTPNTFNSVATLFSDRTFTDANGDFEYDEGDQITPMLSTPSGWEIDPAAVAPSVSC